MTLIQTMRLFLHGLGLAALTMACQTVDSERPNCLAALPGSDTPCRPYRAGMLKLNPELDAVKPLAAIEHAGFAIVGDTLIGTLDDQWLTALRLGSLEPLWFLKLPAAPSAPLMVHGNRILIGLRDGQVFSVDQASGEKQWSQQLGRFLARPMTVSGSTVLAVNVDQQMFALDMQSGKRLWIYDPGRPTSLVVQGAAAPTVAGQQVFMGIANGEVHSIDLSNGRLLWRHVSRFSEARFRDVIGQMVVYNQLLLFARYDGKYMAIDISGGGNRVAWEHDVSSITSTAFRDDVLYLGLLNGDVLAINASSGKQIWRASTGSSVASLTTGERIVYTGGSQGRINALDNQNGSLLWHDDLQGSLSLAPILHDGLLYFPSGLKVLYRYKI